MNPFIGPENDYLPLLDEPGVLDLPSVSVVIPVYNRVELLQRALAALSLQNYEGTWDVIVADDGSDEDVAAAVSDVANRTNLQVQVVHQSRDGYGAGRARNLGAKSSRSQVLVFIDADCMPQDDFVAQHAQWHQRATNLVIIGSRHHVDTTDVSVDSILARGTTFEAASGSRDFRDTFHRRTTQLRHGDEAFRSLVSSNFSVRKTTFENVGGFDETFKRWGGEDTELGWRLSEAGAFIIPDDDAVMFHQTQIDGEEGWREQARQENDAQIASRIPHRFYRKPVPGRIWVRPKVTWIIHSISQARIEFVWAALSRQNQTDYDTIWVGPRSELAAFLEGNQADPRVSHADTLSQALAQARGQYIATLHSWATPDHRLAARMIRRFDSRPQLGLASVGYQLPTENGPAAFANATDAESVSSAWTSEDLPPFTWGRRRDWSKALLPGQTPAQAFRSDLAWSNRIHIAEPLIALPGEEPSESAEADYPAYQSDRSKLVETIRSRPATAAPALAKFVKSRVTGSPFQSVPAGVSAPASEGPKKPHIRYVGWVGKENFGDEVMFNAVTELMSWGDMHTSGDPQGLLLLGGGTLINRKVYLNWLQTKDSPRIERAVFGTGVANPSFWGITESTAEWLDFLSTCAYVGVRGPMSAQILTDWGMKNAPEIVGDSALLVERPSATGPTQPGLVTICPARTNGELWGDSDEEVFSSLADLTRRLIAEGRDVRFLSCFPADDRPIFEIMRAAGYADLPYVPAYTQPDLAIQLLAESSLVVSERLHGAVLAAACGTPFVGLEYRPKLRDFAMSVSMEDYVLATNDLGGLHEMVTNLESAPAQVIDTMSTMVATYRQRLTAAADTIHKAMQ